MAGENVLIAEQSFGERVRDLRVELGLTQPELAALFPATSRGERTANWISGIEAGNQRVRLDEIPQFAKVLNVDVRWLLTGEASGMTEFTARMSELELELDGRAVRAIIAFALQQVEELRRDDQ